MKTFLDVLKLSGFTIPAWIFIIILVCILIYGIINLFSKFVVPKVEQYISLKKDIGSIAELKEQQEKAIQKSIDGDAKLNDRIDKMDDKLDKIVDSLSTLKDYTEQQKNVNDSLANGLKMMLANELDKKYRRYLELGYIPNNEFDEYCETYRIYHDELHGNHTGTQKYNYVMEHLERKV